MKVFVPLTDEMLENMDGSESPVPYQVGLRLQPRETGGQGESLNITYLADELPDDHPVPAQATQQGQR